MKSQKSFFLILTLLITNTMCNTWATTGATFTHDPSVIYADGLYWMFFTADGIGVKYSSDGKNWTDGIRIFQTAPSWWKEYVPAKTDFNIWAPDISYYNGYYNLYYAVSTFGNNVSCIGLIRCTSIAKGDWVDMGLVIRSTQSTKYNCIDPNFIYAHQTPFLVFGAWSGGIHIIRLSSATMKPNASATKIATRSDIETSNAIENAYVWDAGNGFFYLFASFDKCCEGVNSTYNVRYGRAQAVDGPYVDKNGVSMLEGGGTVLLSSSGNMIGPGGESLFKTADGGMAIVYHFYDSNNNGMATIRINDISIVDGWPSI